MTNYENSKRLAELGLPQALELGSRVFVFFKTVEVAKEAAENAFQEIIKNYLIEA